MEQMVQEELASVRGIVDLTPQEALNEARDFLTQQGYRIMHRTVTTLHAERQNPSSVAGGRNALMLIVVVVPQPEGGVRITVRGNDREGVRERQVQWLEWSESLPKKQPEEPQPEPAVTTEEDTTEAIESGGAPSTTVTEGNMSQARYCSSCGQQLDPDARFCPSCGQPVHESARIPTPQANVATPPPPEISEYQGEDQECGAA